MTGYTPPKTARLALLALTVLAFSRLASAATCDQACLLEQAKLFNAAHGFQQSTDWHHKAPRGYA